MFWFIELYKDCCTKKYISINFRNLNYFSIFHSFILFLKESTQTVQTLQHSTVDGPLTASKDLEIKNLKEEIEKLRKQVAGKLL
jgi:hypothetical protein